MTYRDETPGTDVGAGAALLAFFHETLNAYSARHADYFSDPAAKNRLQAINLVRGRLPSRLDGDLETAAQMLKDIVHMCEAEFEPAFDTEYGTGRPVFGLLLSELGKYVLEHKFRHQGGG